MRQNTHNILNRKRQNTHSILKRQRQNTHNTVNSLRYPPSCPWGRARARRRAWRRRWPWCRGCPPWCACGSRWATAWRPWRGAWARWRPSRASLTSLCVYVALPTMDKYTISILLFVKFTPHCLYSVELFYSVFFICTYIVSCELAWEHIYNIFVLFITFDSFIIS